MPANIPPYPARPAVRVGRQVYLIVEPADLRELVAAIAGDIYSLDLPAEIRHRRFARALLAAAANAVLGEPPMPPGPAATAASASGA